MPRSMTKQMLEGLDMKVKKIKNEKIIRRAIYAVAFMGIGAWIHAMTMPDMSAFMGPKEPPRVLTRNLSKGDVSQKKKYIAEVEAINSVDIVPQVSGYLEQILFENGAEVKKGDKIFVIEQTQYKADLEKAEAAVKQLQKQYERVSSLNKQKFASDKEIDLAESNLRQAKAQLEIARLNLEHSEIKSPISGKIGKALVTIGNLVSPSSGRLARVVQTNPVRIAFSVSDKERSVFMEKAAAAETVYVDIVLPNGKTATSKAENLFFNNEVNQETATIPVYLDFDNSENLLVPGNYVDIYVRFKTAQEALLVPQQALMSDINGNYVMVVKEDNTVEQRYVKLGDIMEENQVVLNGLKGNEKVIVQGLQKVTAGAVVNPTHLNEDN